MPPCYAQFTMTSAQELSDAQYLNLVGVNQKLSTAIAKESFFVDLFFEDVDFTVLQIGLGELSAKTDDVEIYEELIICPLVSTIVDDARITTELAAKVGAYNSSDDQIMIRENAVESLSPNRFFVDGDNTRLIFNSSELGKTITIKIPVLKDDIACIGGESSRGEFYNMGFQGSFLSTGSDDPYHIIIPNLRRITGPSLIASGQSVGFTITYQAVCGDNDNFERKPFKILSPSSGIPLGVFNILLESGDNLLLEDGGLLLTQASG